MKHINLIILGGLVVILAILFGAATLKSTSKYKFKVTAKEMLKKVTEEGHFISMNEAAEKLSNNNYLLVDIRTPKEYLNNHISNALNIPYTRLLEDDYKEVFLSQDNTKILYGNSSVAANAAWMVLTQFGYEKIVVLDGSISDWNNFIVNKDLFKENFKSDEVPSLDYAAALKQ